jgi:hypothetical protein
MVFLEDGLKQLEEFGDAILGMMDLMLIILRLTKWKKLEEY